MSGGGCRGCCGKKQSSYDWLSDIPEALRSSQMVEVQFKNTRKGYYLNSEQLDLSKGDMVAVEAATGHDIGEVTLTGKLVELAIKKHNWRPDKGEIQKIYRIARPNDLDRWEEIKRLEEPTMIQARQIASDLGLEMKIGDVEYQGDGNKAIFYYIADGRVDFRQLIRVLADTFHVRIEMKQIGARQEAGRIGGIGPCGRELCCSGFMTNFQSVNTQAARIQDISLNPQKLAGMCGKLKCCMNYEVNTYAEVQRQLPNRETVLETKHASYYHFKTDILQRQMTYSTSPRFPEKLITISSKRVQEVINMNAQGQKPDMLDYDDERAKPVAKPLDILEDNSLTRFDKKRKPQEQRRQRPGQERTPRSASGQGKPHEGQRSRGNRPQRPRSDDSKLSRGNRSGQAQEPNQ